MPVKVFSENNCVRNHAADIAAYGTKTLIVTGRHSAEACGALKDVTDALASEGVSYVHFNKVEENPSVETIMKARDLGLKEGADFVIGIGGGSPMDAAKAVALMMKHSDKDASYLYEKGVDSSTLPIIEIPTTCGTGSEVTAVSILTRHDTHSKGSIPHKIFGNLALLDARYLESASPATLASTAVDALAHLIESYISADATVFSRDIALTGLRTWIGTKDILMGLKPPARLAGSSDSSTEFRTSASSHDMSTVKLPFSNGDLERMLLASTYGGMAIAHTGTSLPHALSYTLTCDLGMKHGKACGYFLAGYMKEADPADVKSVLDAAGFTSIEDYEQFYEEACGRDTVSRELLEKAVAAVLANPGKIKKAPFHVDRSVMERIAGL